MLSWRADTSRHSWSARSSREEQPAAGVERYLGIMALRVAKTASRLRLLFPLDALSTAFAHCC